MDLISIPLTFIRHIKIQSAFYLIVAVKRLLIFSQMHLKAVVSEVKSSVAYKVLSVTHRLTAEPCLFGVPPYDGYFHQKNHKAGPSMRQDLAKASVTI